MAPASDERGVSKNKPAGRPFLGVTFDCCKIYVRVYRNAAGSAYEGRCPRCYKRVRFVVGEGGSGTRFWTVR